jgi:hypothetical protein
VKRFLDYLRHEYVPTRWNGNTKPLSPSSIRNYWVGLRSFWNWAKVELNAPDALATIPPPLPRP